MQESETCPSAANAPRGAFCCNRSLAARFLCRLKLQPYATPRQTRDKGATRHDGDGSCDRRPAAKRRSALTASLFCCTLPKNKLLCSSGVNSVCFSRRSKIKSITSAASSRSKAPTSSSKMFDISVIIFSISYTCARSAMKHTNWLGARSAIERRAVCTHHHDERRVRLGQKRERAIAVSLCGLDGVLLVLNVLQLVTRIRKRATDN
eukprot:COSAG03_NODE_5056_length_1351_cov_1.673323_2_plen_207_part_00